jgi:hypothetical protein
MPSSPQHTSYHSEVGWHCKSVRAPTNPMQS